ncbi:c-type cytochrome [Ancylomarina longa]|uniref:Cytochrome c n=1 Tax=Ancylomarina longa TaxID=2487017 RepID=A0A434AY76_9BACT|nr:cytochrome c [Ancylomarina longa]RUT79391.1 cytochrome c [Ancylomarina longa]
MKNIYQLLTCLILILSLSNFTVQAEDWGVPSSAKKKHNPYDANVKNISSGKKIFNINCKTCHGDPGKGNMIHLVPISPTDIGSQDFLVQTDGEIYYKINKGNGAMPTFEKTLNDEHKWMVITYLRSFDKSNRRSEKLAEVKNPEVTDVKLDLEIQDSSKYILAHLTGMTKKGKRVGLHGIEMSFLVKRNFGYLDISREDAYTDDNGKVETVFPYDLPGDREGHVDLLVKLTDDAFYGNLEKSQIVSLGVPTIPVNPLDERAMWGTRANAPIWIMVSYIGGVFVIWGVIFFVLFQMIKIPRLAQNKE